VPEQTERLAGLIEAQEAALERLRSLPADTDAATARLEGAVSTLPLEVARRIAEAVPEGLPDILLRLEEALRRVPGEDAREATVATIASLSGDIGVSVRRVEAALTDHDAALSRLIGSMQAVGAATEEVRAASGGADPGAALAATLTHLAGVTEQTELLARQTEALAEAVMSGRAPGLSVLIADRTPALLAGVEATTRRLRSVATALALAGDGPVRRAV
jgi:hypothetical protein